MRTALLALLMLVALPALAQRRRPRPPPPPPPVEHHGPTRIDMETTELKGQRPAYGAVMLYDRKDLKVRSMVKLREDFRDEL
jgi:hypothetical protein